MRSKVDVTSTLYGDALVNSMTGDIAEALQEYLADLLAKKFNYYPVASYERDTRI